MYCSNCGKKIKEGAKFCPSCGEKVFVKDKDNVKKPTEVEIKIVQGQGSEKPKPKPNGCCTAILVFFILSMTISAIGYLGSNDKSGFAGLIGALFILGIFAVLVWLSISSVKWLVKLGVKKPIALLIVLVIALAILIPAYLSYQSYTYGEISKRVFFLEDKVTELSAAKMLGDTIMKPGALPVDGVTIKDVNGAASAEKKRIEEVTYPMELNGYKGVAIAWADKIATAKDAASWNALSDSPEKFELVIPDDQVEKIFKQTVYDIAAVRDAGDWAIKKQDRNAMRFVAARLVAIDHLLTSIETYQSVAQNSFIKPAYALTRSGAVMKTRKLCFMNGKSTICLPEARDSVRSAKSTATKLYVFTSPERYTALPDSNISETGWDNAFQGIDSALDEANMQYLGGAGITEGQPNTGPQLSPRELAFRNNCRSRGGDPDPSSIVKERLPTTESGYNCKIGGCWEFMTAASGRTYSGGNPGCPEQGLVPRAPIKIPDIIPTPSPTPTPPKPISYDGTYHITYNYGNCGSNITGFSMPALGAVSDSITVRNNVVTWSAGTAKIDSNGRAVWSSNLGGLGNFQQIFNFTGSRVSGTFSAKVSTQGVGVNCAGSFTGSKQ